MWRQSITISAHYAIILLPMQERAEHDSSALRLGSCTKAGIWRRDFFFREAAHRGVSCSFLGLPALERAITILPTLPYTQKYFHSQLLLANLISVMSQHPPPLATSSWQRWDVLLCPGDKRAGFFRVGLNIILPVTLKTSKTSGAMPIANTTGTSWSNAPRPLWVRTLLPHCRDLQLPETIHPDKTKPDTKRCAEQAEVQAVCSVVPRHTGTRFGSRRRSGHLCEGTSPTAFMSAL